MCVCMWGHSHLVTTITMCHSNSSLGEIRNSRAPRHSSVGLPEPALPHRRVHKPIISAAVQDHQHGPLAAAGQSSHSRAPFASTLTEQYKVWPHIKLQSEIGDLRMDLFGRTTCLAQLGVCVCTVHMRESALASQNKCGDSLHDLVNTSVVATH